MPIAAPDETATLWTRFLADRDDHSRTALIEHYAPLVANVVAPLVPRLGCGIEPEDAESAGLLALVRAVDEFDPARGAGRFEPYAIQRIRWAVGRLIQQESFRPKRVAALSARFEREAGTELTRITAPQMEQIAAELAVSVDEAYQMRARILRGALLAVEEIAPLLDEEADTAEDARRNIIRARVAAGVEALPEPERSVILAHWWRGETYQAIGARMARAKSTTMFFKDRGLWRLAHWLMRDEAFRRAGGWE